MKLLYFTESAYQELFDSTLLNIPHYSKDADNSWINEYFQERIYCKESRIDATLPKLDKGSDAKTEYSNTYMLYGALKDKLTPKQASNPYLWSYLTHCYYWDYVKDRWLAENEKPSKEKINYRFFCGNEQGNRIGLLRNAISRFWWAGYLTYKENCSKPYELTELLFTNTDLAQSILERKFSMNRTVTLGILEAIKEINDDPSLDNVGVWKNAPEGLSQKPYEWGELCKYINRYGAVTLLDTLSQEDITELSKDYILNTLR